MAHAGTDQSANDAAGRIHSIGIDDRQRDTVRHTKGDDAALAVITARVIDFDMRSRKDQRSEFKIESALRQIAGALGGVPLEGHRVSIQLYIQLRRPVAMV